MREVSYDEIRKDVETNIDRGNQKIDLGKQFEMDKNKIEDAIEKVQESDIDPQAKAGMIKELNIAIDKLESQYEDEVTKEIKRDHGEMEKQFDDMNRNIEALSEVSDSIKETRMDVASVDTSAAVEEANEKKQQFEQMKEEYAQKLNLQIEQAEMMERNIRARRLSGR